MRRTITKSQDKKKASTTVYFTIISLLIATIVIIKLFTFSAHSGTYEDYMSRFYSKDLAFLLETIQSVPGDIQITYPVGEEFKITMKQNQLEISYNEGVSNTKTHFELFPQTKIIDSEAKNYLIITKKGSTIKISEKPEIEANNCIKPNFFPRKEEAIGFNTEERDGVLKEKELRLIKETMKYEANKINKQSITPSIIITITSTKNEEESVGENINKNKILLTRPKATGFDEEFLRYFYCALNNKISNDDELNFLSLQEEIEGSMNKGDDFQITLDFQISEQMKETILNNRNKLAKIMIKTISELQPETE